MESLAVLYFLLNGGWQLNDTADDKQLILLIAQKDSNALELLYDRYERVIYSFAYQIVKDSMAAEEVMQELFLRLWKNAGQIDFGKGKLLTWMFAVTRNLAIDYLRKRDARLPRQSADSGNLEQVQDHSALTEDLVEPADGGGTDQRGAAGIKPRPATGNGYDLLPGLHPAGGSTACGNPAGHGQGKSPAGDEAASQIVTALGKEGSCA